MSPYQLIVFDWDGTLVDSTGHIVQCMKQAIEDLSLPMLADEQISHIIGLGLIEAVQTLYPQHSPSAWQTLADQYRQVWLSSPPQTPLFENARELISQLAQTDCFLGIATGKSRNGLNKALDSTQLESYFHATRCADECHSKPHPQMLQELMDYFGVKASETLMIGDTEFDLLMAHNAGAHSVGITHGAHAENKLQACNPKAIFHNLQQLRNWLHNQGINF